MYCTESLLHCTGRKMRVSSSKREQQLLSDTSTIFSNCDINMHFVNYSILQVSLTRSFPQSTSLYWKKTLRGKCPYFKFFWSVFSNIRTEYAEIWRIILYSVRLQENTDQKIFEYGHILRSVMVRDDAHKKIS